MRNVLVVLVFSCVGFSFGFVVPSGLLGTADELQAILTDNTEKESEETTKLTLKDNAFKTNKNKPNDLESNENRIKDNELYEQNNGKENNVNERSFVYINQKYKTPVMTQLYRSSHLLEDAFSSLVVNERSFGGYPDRYPLSKTKAKKDYFTAKVLDKEPYQTLYFPTNVQYVNQDVDQNMDHDMDRNMDQDMNDKEKSDPSIASLAVNKFTDMQREYVELLKPPILRMPSLDSPRKKMQWPDMEPNFYYNYKNVNGKLTKPNYPTDIVDKPSAAKPVKYYDPDSFGFRSSFGQRSTSNQQNTNFKNVEKNLAINSKIKHLIKDNNEVSQLLDKFLKNSLDDSTVKERLNANNNKHCNDNDCVTKSEKRIPNRDEYVNNCKCGNHANVKQRNSLKNTSKPPPQMVDGSSTENTLNSKSSEVINEYVDLFNDDTNFKALMTDK